MFDINTVSQHFFTGAKLKTRREVDEKVAQRGAAYLQKRKCSAES